MYRQTVGEIQMQPAVQRLVYSEAQRLNAVKKRKLRKVVDDTDAVRSRTGSVGLLKEEVWVDEANRVMKYSLAYINHAVCREDNGRVLGYDNAHGHHERHWMGTAEQVPFTTYEDCVRSFLDEVRELREQT